MQLQSLATTFQRQQPVHEPAFNLFKTEPLKPALRFAGQGMNTDGDLFTLVSESENRREWSPPTPEPFAEIKARLELPRLVLVTGTGDLRKLNGKDVLKLVMGLRHKNQQDHHMHRGAYAHQLAELLEPKKLFYKGDNDPNSEVREPLRGRLNEVLQTYLTDLEAARYVQTGVCLPTTPTADGIFTEVPNLETNGYIIPTERGMAWLKE